MIIISFLLGPKGQKSSAESIIILIAGCLGLLYGRIFGYLLHETTANNVPLYHISLVLISNGISTCICATDNFTKIIPFFGMFGCLFGKFRRSRTQMRQ